MSTEPIHERTEALAANARPTPKGQAVTLDVYVYPDGTSAVRSKGDTGSHSHQCNTDGDLAITVQGVAQQMRNPTHTTRILCDAHGNRYMG